MAQAAAPAPLLVLQDTQQQLDAQEHGEYWFDASGAATLAQVIARRATNFEPTHPDQVHALGEHGQLWLHWRITRGTADENGWVLVFPMPVLDEVTLFQQNERLQWIGQSAGDTMAVATWAEPGRYPHFRVELPAGQVRDVYARIRHLTPANFPAQLMSESDYDQRIQIEYLGLGLAFGALLLLIAACVAQAFVYRDGVYGWYALYALVTALGVTAYTGVAAHLLWPSFGALRDAPQGMLALLAAAAAVLFVRNLTGISARYRHLDQFVFWAGLAGLLLAAAFPFMHKGAALTMMALYVASATLGNMWVAYAAWRRGDVVGAWVLLAYLPLSVAVAMALLRIFGVLPVSFGTQYAIVVAMALEVPLLLVALNIRSRERHGAEIRELALSSQDALTGLLASHLFHDRLRQVVARYKRDKENAAVVFIDLVNYPRIKAAYGPPVAEQSLLRCVIKLRRLLRDVDTVSRIGEARFGLILEGVTSRVAVTDRAARLIAAGLMPLQGLKPEVTLQFHIGAVLLDERMVEAPDLVDALDELLGSMSSRTRRPIRFLEPDVTAPADLDDTDPSELDGDSLPGREPEVTAPMPIVSQSASPQ
jgi:diguanylate cyclase (GGDEF)-like protein